MLNRLLRACMDYIAPMPRPPAVQQRIEPGEQGPPELCRARQLVAAVDKGGLPLNPAIVNQIARGLGLEVSSKAPIGETVERIRQALSRAGEPS
jgi:hypothetical protein